MRAPLVLLAGLAALLTVSSAFAHAEPAEVKPGHGAVVTTPPVEVVILMSQDMARREGANTIRVFSAEGVEVTRVAAVIDNANRRRLSVPLPSSLEPGEYTIRWTTLSDEDGDDASGELSFTYDPAGAPDPGQEVLREELAPLDPASQSPSPLVPQNETGMSWIFVVAVAVGALAVGAGGGYLFVQKRA